MLKRLSILLTMMLFMTAVYSAVQQPAPTVPKTTSTTASGCLQEVRDYAAKRQSEMMAATAPATPPATLEAAIELNQRRAPLVSQINQAKAIMAKECASRLDTKSVPSRNFITLPDLYTEAGQASEAKTVVDRALAATDLAPSDHASVLVYAIRSGLREPKSDERYARLEKYVSELDASPS